MASLIDREAEAGVEAGHGPAGDGPDRQAADWYKDAIIYQLHVKAYQDASGDGIGDFAGLTSRLDHIESLGVTAIWLMPFYPSPLRDDGYDIADYESVNPRYGDMEDFRAFLDEAHRRGLKVVTELVINHTSDQHAWFQAARQAPPESPERDMYVWSDTDQKFLETRIIFIDTETSNWTFDPVAQAFFWHRFYSHQPDLNFDNPRVLAEVLRVMRMWLDMGVDGLRLDAIPYLVEREGTNNENLPETHDVLKEVRAALDRHYPDRMLLAEANQWPEDTRPYFGEGDECHMAFHFPLMPRMYMALAQEDRHPITDILRQTPDIPETCQWAIFLRNHDELTLEMVTAEERDYLWRTYAEDTRARINLGIRRRLAPLMQNDRRKIELMNGLLMSMPGTPVVYYGDEIGMGDNYYLGDRDGVRTPMQWSADRNAGFSRANPQALYLPVIQDPVHGYQAVNVETAQADPSSLLNWMRRLIAVRKRHLAFGRGAFTLIYPRNRKVLAYLRTHGDETILCVANLARTAEAAELDLSAFRGRVPVELQGASPFPPIGDGPYALTLSPYGFFWFRLADAEAAPSWHIAAPEPLPEFVTVTTAGGRLSEALRGRDRALLEREVLPEFLRLQRWFAAKGDNIASVRLSVLPAFDPNRAPTILDVSYAHREPERYFLPLKAVYGEETLRPGAPMLPYTIAKVRHGARTGALVDASRAPGFARSLVEAMREGRVAAGEEGRLVAEASAALHSIGEIGEARPVAAEQSNVSIVLGSEVILKIYRRLREGEQPDIEMARFLTERAAFAHTPAYLGSIRHEAEGGGPPTVLAAAFAFVPNQGDGWSVVTDALVRHLETASLGGAGEEDYAAPLGVAGLVGRRTAQLHQALAVPTEDQSFAIEPMTADDVALLVRQLEEEARRLLDRLDRQAGPDEPPALAELRESRDRLTARIAAFARAHPSGYRSRVHGDFHLGQTLVAQGDIAIIDFEGEPERPIEARRQKAHPLVDVAGLLRSLDYAAAAALRRFVEQGGAPDAARPIARQWLADASAAFLAGYREATLEVGKTLDLTADDDLLALFLFRKAVYEVGYEAANRPDWVAIPAESLLTLLDPMRGKE